MDNQRIMLTDVQDFLIEVPEIKSRGEIIGLGILMIIFGFWSTMPSLYLAVAGLVVLFIGLKRKAARHACLVWADICERYIDEEYGFDWHCGWKCFYKKGADLDKDHEIPIYHNPQNSICWDGDKPLFNLKRFDETRPYKVMPNYYSLAESCLNFKDVLMLGIFSSDQHFYSKVAQKTPSGFPAAIYQIRRKSF